MCNESPSSGNWAKIPVLQIPIGVIPEVVGGAEQFHIGDATADMHLYVLFSQYDYARISLSAYVCMLAHGV